MLSLIDYKKKIVVFWSMKAACTSLTGWFYNRYLPAVYDPEALGLIKGHAPREWLRKNGYVADEMVGMRLMADNGFTGIAWVRHPMSRAISAYINKFVDYNGTPLKQYEDLEPFAKTLARKLYAHKGWDLNAYNGFSFLDFLGFVQKVFDAPETFGRLDPHFAPQLVNSYDENPFDHILKVEDSEACETILSDQFGFPYTTRRANQSNYGTGLTDKLDSLPATDLIPLYGQFGPENLITEQSVALATSLYGQDYRIFGYDALPPAMPA